MLALYFIKHLDRVSRYVTFRNVTLAGVSKLAGQHEMEEYAMEGSVITPMVHTKDWPKTLESVEEYLFTFCGVNGTSLSYVAKKQILPTAEADDPSKRYDTFNGEMIARSSIVVADNVRNTVSLE